MMTDTNSDDSYTDEESPKKRRDLLVRRPSYRKILNDLGGGGEIGMLLAGLTPQTFVPGCFHLWQTFSFFLLLYGFLGGYL